VPVAHRAPRGIRKDTSRKLGRPMQDVQVVLLRRQRGYTDEPEVGSGHELKWTIWVHGYWAVRHTREGPRQTWVRPHIKGRGPFKETKRAWEFRR
jgi:hypothetical protein